MQYSENRIREMRIVMERRHYGYAAIQKDRDEALLKTVTKDSMKVLGPAFDMATSIPLRESSGLIDYCETLSRLK